MFIKCFKNKIDQKLIVYDKNDSWSKKKQKSRKKNRKKPETIGKNKIVNFIKFWMFDLGILILDRQNGLE